MRRFRPFLALLTALVLLMVMAPAPAAAEIQNLDAAGLTRANVSIDGQILNADAFLVEGRTMVPLRAIFEALGATIEWDGPSWTVTATKGTTVVKLTVGEGQGYVNGKAVTLAVPAVLINSRTFVPLRFVGDALGAQVGWDQPSFTALIKTGGDCNLAPFQKHEGTITRGGETWGRCGSPHIVSGTFLVEGADSPILSIQDGAVVQFEADARIEVGHNAPGGLKVYGTEKEPIVFTAATSGPQPGFWHGIRFYNQTLINDTVIENARIEYAGENDYGAIYVEGWQKTVEVLLKNVEIKNTQGTGLRLAYQGRLKAGSMGLKISKTSVAGDVGGFPIITSVFGSHNLPRGEFKENAINAVSIDASTDQIVATNTTWRNVSIPYAISNDVYVEGSAAPTLTVEPGVITLWAPDSSLYVGYNAPGHLIADAVARPEGGGEWFTRPEGGGEWKVGKAELDLGVQLANAGSLEPGCALCGKNRAIVFGSWNAAPDRGAWNGIRLYGNAGDKSRLNGVVIAWGGGDEDYSAGLYAESNGAKVVKFQVSNSLITGAARSGMEFWGNVQIKTESTGNFFAGNGWPLRMAPEHIGYMPAGQTYTDNDSQIVSVYDAGSAAVTKTATWRDQGIPYQFETSVYVGGTAKPVVTIEAGTKLVFTSGTRVEVGYDGTGSLVAVGTAAKPITFTGESGRAGAWDGIIFSSEAGKGNMLERVVIEYADYAVQVTDDMGGFIKNTTIRSSKSSGIYRYYGTEGTSFTTGLGNQFEGNATDEE
jgi:hypothetical protein